MPFGCFGGRPPRSKSQRGISGVKEQPAAESVSATAAKPHALAKACHYYTYRELEEATNSWAHSHIIGDGGFGRVYKGRLRNGVLIAAKRLDRHGLQGDKEFNVEVNTLIRLRHPNIVKLLGVCVEGDQRIGVFELLSRGSLAGALTWPDQKAAGGSGRAAAAREMRRQVLGWRERVQIALGVARGLAHMHKERFIHRDVTTGNVLLADDALAQLADFGLAQQLSTPESVMIAAPVEDDSILMGTHGYLAPEYMTAGELSQKSDVYAFGVVMLELLTGKPAVEGSRPPGCQLLAEWLLPSLSSVDLVWDHLDKALDRSTVSAPQLATMAEVALACLSATPSGRPHMKDVVQFIEAAAAFEPEAPVAVSSQLREAASRQTSSFEDPFCSNPFAAASIDASPLHAPLSKGRPGGPTPSRATPLEHVSGSSASTSTPVLDPYAVSPSRHAYLSRLSASRAAHSVPKAQPEDWASPLQSGLRFGVLSQVSPEVSPEAAKHNSSSQAEAEGDMAMAKRVATAGSSLLFEALTSRESSPESAAEVQQVSSHGSPSTPDKVPQHDTTADSQPYQCPYPDVRNGAGTSHEQGSSNGSTAETQQAEIQQAGSNPFLRPGKEDPFAVRVRLKEWQMAGPPSAPAYLSPRGHLAPRDLDRSLDISQQRDGPAHATGALADSAASLNMSALASSRQRQGPNAARAARQTPSAITEEGIYPDAITDGNSASTTRAQLGTAVGRRGSGNPFNDEECPPTGPHGSCIALESALSSGNPFVHPPSVEPRGAAPACRSSISGRLGSVEITGWPQWPEDSQGHQAGPQFQSPVMCLPRSPRVQKAA